MKLKYRLFLIVGIAMLVVSSIYTFGLLHFHNTNLELAENSRITTEKLDKIARLNFDFKSEVQAWKNMLIRGKDPEKLAKYQDDLKKKSEKVQQTAIELSNLIKNVEDLKLIQQFTKSESELFNSYTQAATDYLMSDKFDPSAADKSVEGKDRPVTKSLDKLAANIEEQITTFGLSQKEKQINLFYSILLTATVALLSSLIAVWISLNRINKQLLITANSLSNTSESVKDVIFNLVEASESLSSSTQETSQSIENIAQSTNFLAQNVRLNSQTIDKTSGLSVEGNLIAKKSQEKLMELMNSMEGIQIQSRKIEDIAQVIDDLAFQTNLLALNASVEAARAGEQGKGFAVVAAAVRTLAQKSATSAKNIDEIIQDSSKEVRIGVSTASASQDAIFEITKTVSRISELNQEVVISANHQLSGIEEIDFTLKNIDTIAKENANSALSLSKSAEELKNHTLDLDNSMAQLKRWV